MTWLVTSALLAVHSLPCQAQLPADSALDAVLRTAVSRSWHVQLTTPAAVYHGRALSLSGDTIQLVGRRVPLNTIVRVDRRLKEGGGTVMGGLIGAAAGAATGFFISALCETGDCGLIRISATAIGAGIGGVMGALAGSIADPPDVVLQSLWPVKQ